MTEQNPCCEFCGQEIPVYKPREAVPVSERAVEERAICKRCGGKGYWVAKAMPIYNDCEDCSHTGFVSAPVSKGHEKVFSAFDLENAFMAGWDRKDYEEWFHGYKKSLFQQQQSK